MSADPDSTASRIELFAADEQHDVDIDVDRWFRLAQSVLGEEGAGDAGEVEMSLLFVDEATISSLNEQFMGKRGPTDVLSFPIDEVLQAGGRSPDGGTRGPGAPFDVENESTPDDMPLMLGDVLICPDVALRNAPEHQSEMHDGSIEDEIALLVVHGILHLLGMDHQADDEAEAMEARERVLLERFHRPQRPISA